MTITLKAPKVVTIKTLGPFPLGFSSPDTGMTRRQRCIQGLMWHQQCQSNIKPLIHRIYWSETKWLSIGYEETKLYTEMAFCPKCQTYISNRRERVVESVYNSKDKAMNKERSKNGSRKEQEEVKTKGTKNLRIEEVREHAHI